MKLSELGCQLKNMYQTAEKGEAVTMIHLFGIKYAEKITSSEYTTKEIVAEADMNDSYVTELYKGIKLAKYVSIKS